MTGRGCRVVLLAALLAAAAPVTAEETIGQYRVLVEIDADASLTITETIAVRAEGDAIRRGIYRDFPTRYRDRYGNRVVVGFEVLGVERDGAAEHWFTEAIANGVRVNTGGDALLAVPRDYVYTLRYRTNRQLGFFAGHDELYWNAIGTGWAFPIERAEVEVRLPAPVPVAELHAEAYTGGFGEQGRDWRAQLPGPGRVRFETTRRLRAYEGLTVVVAFPKGLVAPPTAGDRVGWFVRDNLGAALALFGFAGVLLFYLWRWRRHGRDPRPGVIFPQYRPPPGMSPALLRYVWKMGYSPLCLAADIVELGVRGLLRIEREKSLFKQAWVLHRTGAERPAELPAGQRALLEGLLPAGTPRLALEQRHHAVIGAARAQHLAALRRAAEPRYFVGNTGTVALGAGFSVLVVLLAFEHAHTDAGAVIAFLVMLLLIFVNLMFLHLMRQPTAEGRALLDRIEGLRQYLGVAERDELRALPAPGEPEPALDAGRYEALLPYALALEVEEAWTGRFVAAVGAAAAAQSAQRLGWYSGGPVARLGDVSSALASSLGSAISASASPPGSSSGSGGGGSSGGGGGGGGGGGR